jgi:tRNA modification GTPase
MPGPDTIAALSSAAGASRLAIIRVSGPRAVEIVDSFCAGAKLAEVAGFRTASVLFELPDVGRVSCDVYIFGAPASYTTEDVAEIHLPGSPLLAEKVLLALLSRGARPAQPGEFTRRAYLGGRLDLARAEAVSAVIEARSSAELTAAGRVLTGSLSEELSDVNCRLKDLLALVEAGIDFGDQDIELVSAKEISSRIHEILKLLESHSRRDPQPGRDMLRVLICGTANVGKSSLFNRLLGRERVLTSSSPGTTRDTVSTVLKLGGTDVLLLDSVGRKSPESEIEELALSMLEKTLADTDVALFVIEAHRELTKDEAEFFEGIACRKLMVANKCDLACPARSSTYYSLLSKGKWKGESRAVLTSCRTGEGIDNLREALERLVLGEVERHPDALALSVRQRDALSRAADSLRRALEVEGEELLAEDLREALTALGEITGETLTEEILDRIFERFCVGK